MKKHMTQWLSLLLCLLLCAGMFPAAGAEEGYQEDIGAISDPVDFNEMVVEAEPTDMIDPMDADEPEEAVYLMETVEPEELIDQAEATEPAEEIGPEEVTDPAEIIDLTEAVKPADVAEPVEYSEISDVAVVEEPAESVEATEPAELPDAEPDDEEPLQLEAEAFEPVDESEITEELVIDESGGILEEPAEEEWITEGEAGEEPAEEAVAAEYVDEQVQVVFLPAAANEEAMAQVYDASVTAPKITSHPASVSVSEGAAAKFTTAASGSGLSYQWQVYSSANGAWVNSGISSAKTATLSFTSNVSQNGMKYRCMVSNSAGTVYSNAATLTVNRVAPKITSHPASLSVSEGAAAKFTAAASGSGLSYQWQVYSSTNGAWVNSGISSAKTATLSFTSNISQNGMKYRCRVSNSAGTVYSNAATLTVNRVAPKITSHPASVSVNAGATAKFTAAASGSGLSYQWQVYSSANGTWVNSGISSAKTATLSFTVNSGHNGMKYRCRVSNSAGTVYSNAATLTVKTAPTISGQPASMSVREGNTVKFTVSASGGGLSYQWQVYSASTGKWANSGISSAKTATLSFKANTGHNGMKYRCRVSNSVGTVYSNQVTLTVKPASSKKLTITRVYAVESYDEYYFGPSLVAEFEVTNPDEVTSVVDCIQFELQRCDNGTWKGMQQGVFWSNFRRIYDDDTGCGTFIAELKLDCARNLQYRFLYNFYAYGSASPTETGYSETATY